MKRFLPLALSGLLSCGQSDPPEPKWGAEFVFTVLNRPKEDPAADQMMKNATRVIERRLALVGFRYARVTVLESNQIRIRIPGADSTNIQKAAGCFGFSGSLRVYEMAGQDVQEAYTRSQTVPEGYLAVDNLEPGYRQDLPEYRPWDVDRVLIKKTPLLEQDMIADAWTERSASGRPETAWDTAFALSDEGATRINEAARRLSQQHPTDLIAIISNHKLRAVARMTAETVGREWRITGSASEEEARHLAILLLCGSHKAELGSISKGTATSNEPDSFSYYGTRESPALQLQKLR